MSKRKEEIKSLETEIQLLNRQLSVKRLKKIIMELQEEIAKP